MKRAAALLGFCTLLVSCGGGGGSSHNSVSCEDNYWDGQVGTCIVSGWDTLDEETLRQRGVPEETIVAFQSQEAISGQFPTVAITREQLPNDVDAKQYSDANIRAVEVFDGYKHVDSREVTVAGHDVLMHIFTAQPIEGEPRRRFYQVSVTDGDVGYTATAVTPVTIGEAFEKKMLLMVTNLTFKEPVAEGAE